MTSGDDEIWAIRHRETKERAGVATFFSQRGAERKIQEWIDRCKGGGRPDLSLEWLEELEVYEL